MVDGGSSGDGVVLHQKLEGTEKRKRKGRKVRRKKRKTVASPLCTWQKINVETANDQ